MPERVIPLRFDNDIALPEDYNRKGLVIYEDIFRLSVINSKGEVVLARNNQANDAR